MRESDARDRAREAALAAALDAVFSDDVDGWLDCPGSPSDPDWDAGLRVWMTVIARLWDSAIALAEALPEPPEDDVDARWLRRGAALWARSGDPGPDSDRCLAVYGGELPDPGYPLGQFTAYLLVEAALAHARLDLAVAAVDQLGDRLWRPLLLGGRPHPYEHALQVCRIRVLAFGGEIAAAKTVLQSMGEPPAGPVAALVLATRVLVLGNDSDSAEVRRLVEEVDGHAPVPRNQFSAGAQTLTAFGLLAMGDVGEAARRILVAGGDSGLSRLNVADRAFAFEMLVSLAVAEEDLDAAEAWAQHAVPLLVSPIADSTVARILSRICLLTGDVDLAMSWAERAVARAREVGRTFEYVEGELVLSRARLDPRSPGGAAAAARALEEMVAEAESRGHHRARREATRELRHIGLRLRPLSGSGWSGLTAREAEVARAVAEGASNREVARLLNLSDHTVRAHLSRVLAAFGLATRAGLPAAIRLEPSAGAHAGPAPADERPFLTARQRDVAELVGRGHQNAAIATELGISPRTVERHISDILIRWDLASRTAIARAVADSSDAQPS